MTSAVTPRNWSTWQARQEFRQQADALRAELQTMMAAAGEPAAEIEKQKLYP